MGRRVLIVQKTIPQYRRRFFELLRLELAAHDIELVLVYGQPEPDEASKRDLVHLDWAVERRTLFVPLGRRRLYWQSCLSLVPDADLVIVEQASKLLVNYVLLGLQTAGVKRVAFWGHGRTPKASPPSRVGEAAKAVMSRRAHWWFAYNDLSAGFVQALGFPVERITSVENAIDTRRLAAAGAAVTESELEGLRGKLGLTGNNVCLFVGGMYREKRLPFLIAACELIRWTVPDFEMVFVGSGPDCHAVEDAVERNDWMHYIGPVFGDDKVLYFGLAKLVLMPGRVGLGILDAFALRTPLVTTAVLYHAPEVDYLNPDVNGVVVDEADSPAAYARGVARLLSEAVTLDTLRRGCGEAADAYTAESMATRFAAGIRAALAS